MPRTAVAQQVETRSSRERTGERPWTADRRTQITWLCLGALGVVLGVSQVISGGYDETTWSSIALGLLGVALALAIGAPRRPPLGLVVPLLGLWLWSLISSAWSESVDASHTAANRWLLYAAVLVLLAWAVGQDRRRATVLLTGVSAGVLGVAVWLLARMLTGHGPELFLGARLNDPMGYVNGEAGYLLIAAWPCLALAERRGSLTAAAAAGGGMAGFVALISLGLMSQSRSWMAALAVAIVLLLAAVPGRRRRAVALVPAAAAVAAIYATLAHVWQHPGGGVVTAATTRHAAGAIIVAALAAGAVWGLIVAALERFAPAGTPERAGVRRLASGTLAALGVILVVAIAVNAGSLAHRISTQYNAFVHLSTSSNGTRLFSGSGSRYDYWRVALIEFRSAPLAGVGAGNYDPGYYLHRRQNEPITQPHSLELQTLAELGVVGGLLLAGFLVAVALGFGRTARSAATDPVARTVAVSAGGMFAVWLMQTSVDWMHLIPALTAIALAAAVALAIRPERESAALTHRAHAAIVASAAVIAVAGIVTIGPRVLSLDAQASAQHALARGKARTAVADATTALEYDPRSVQALVLRSAGFARLHAFSRSRADLERALRLEPQNWTTWALLGDLLTRHGDRRAARSAYARAAALDPVDRAVFLAASEPARSSPRGR